MVGGGVAEKAINSSHHTRGAKEGRSKRFAVLRDRVPRAKQRRGADAAQTQAQRQARGDQNEAEGQKVAAA